MPNLRSISILILLPFWSQILWGSERYNELVLGVLRQTTAQNYVTGEKTAARPGFGVGAKTESDDYAGFSLKIGLMYEQRTISDVLSGVTHELVMNHVDLLTHLSYRVSDSFSVFTGPQYTILASKKCKPSAGDCLLNESHAAKYFIPMTVGLDFSFMGQYGAEVYYEWISQEVWETAFEKVQTYGLNLKYKF